MKRVEWDRTRPVWEDIPSLVAAWAFGSARDGQVRDGADVDIGLLLETAPDLDELADIRAALQDALDIDDIDLIVLNEASPTLRFEAISGRPLFCRDADRRAEFASLTAREYEDEMAMVAKAMSDRELYGSGRTSTEGTR